MFLIRTAFWLSLLLVVLPIDVETDETSPQQSISTFQAIGAAQSVISDLTQFCDRNQSTCATGSAALEHVGLKARASAKMVYEYLDGTLADPEITSSLPDPAHDTLSANDRDPAWKNES